MLHLLLGLQTELQQAYTLDAKINRSLDHYFEQLYQLDAKEVGLTEMANEEIDHILNIAFSCRLLIHNKIDANSESNLSIEAELLTDLYNMTRALRYLEDYVMEVRMGRKLKQVKYPPLTGEAPYFVSPPNIVFRGPDDLKSGDVILSRGSALTSAAIARIGINDTQFSHLSFVYRNPEENGKLYTVEAHIEIGSVVEPIEIHLQSQNSRSVVYRFEDSQLAHQAAEYMFNKVKEQSATGKNIDYNFSMQYEDCSKLFCSQVIYDGFYQASNHNIVIPRFKTQFHPGLLSFLNRMGIPATRANISEMKTFSPGDIEYDPRFHLVAEWRDPFQLQDTRLKDAVLTKMFAWMSNEQYKIHAPLSVKIICRLIWFFRRVPLVQKLLEKKLPLNMTISQLEIFLTLDKIGGVLLKTLEERQTQNKDPFSLREIFEYLEEFKKNENKNASIGFGKWFY